MVFEYSEEQKMKCSIKDFFSILPIWLHLLKKSLKETSYPYVVLGGHSILVEITPYLKMERVAKQILKFKNSKIICHKKLKLE